MNKQNNNNHSHSERFERGRFSNHKRDRHAERDHEKEHSQNKYRHTYNDHKKHNHQSGDLKQNSRHGRDFMRRGRIHSSPTRIYNQPTIDTSIHKPCGSGPQKSVEGWVIIITHLHEEAQEEDIRELFGEYGQIKSLCFGVDRQTGFSKCKGYAFIEYGTKAEAQDAINVREGSDILGKRIHVDWAFVGSATEDIEDDSAQSRKKYKF